MLRRRYHSQTQAPRKAEGRKKADEILWLSQYSAGSLHRGAESMKQSQRAKVEEQEAAKAVEAAPPVTPVSGNRLRATCNWFFSKTVRHAGAMRKHVQKILNHQRDILS